MVTIDSDGQHDSDQIPQLVEPLLKQTFDIVFGSRFLSRRDKQKVHRYRSFGVKSITKLTQPHLIMVLQTHKADSGLIPKTYCPK